MNIGYDRYPHIVAPEHLWLHITLGSSATWKHSHRLDVGGINEVHENGIPVPSAQKQVPAICRLIIVGRFGETALFPQPRVFLETKVSYLPLWQREYPVCLIVQRHCTNLARCIPNGSSCHSLDDLHER